MDHFTLLTGYADGAVIVANLLKKSQFFKPMVYINANQVIKLICQLNGLKMDSFTFVS